MTQAQQLELSSPRSSRDVAWNKEKVQRLLETRDEAVGKALALIYSHQTAAEQSSDHTNEENGVGFTKFDSEFLSSCAKFFNRTGFLTDKQLPKVRAKIKKYWKQILKDMEKRGYQVSYKV